MRLISFDSIQKKLDKKNSELLKVRSLRKKLADKEKNICADIEFLQNQKVELIFLKVKREIKNEKLNISSGSILPLLQALRSNQSSSDNTSSEEKIVTQTNVSLADMSKITETGRNIDEHCFTPENQELETIIENLQAHGLIEKGTDIISFQDCIDSIKKFAESNGVDELTSILTVQTWIAESKLKTKMSLFLPTYPDSVLTDIEQAPDKLFESMNKARAILKKLCHEEIIPIEEPLTTDDYFRDLKIIYHGSEIILQNEDETVYPNESILTGVSAYEFLRLLKAKAAEIHFKTWLEFSYKNYSHGKFLLSDKIPKDESISAFLRIRLDRNRQHLLHNPQDLKQYIPTGKTIHADDLLQQIKLESTLFQAVMDDFEQEENSYLSNRPELCHLS